METAPRPLPPHEPWTRVLALELAYRWGIKLTDEMLSRLEDTCSAAARMLDRTESLGPERRFHRRKVHAARIIPFPGSKPPEPLPGQIARDVTRRLFPGLGPLIVL